MSMEFVNRICPNCNNPNYMVLLGDFSKAYKYKCMNCNRYFNDIDFEKEPFRSSGNMVEVVRCKDCKWFSAKGFCKHPDGGAGNIRPADWFCADGERE